MNMLFIFISIITLGIIASIFILINERLNGFGKGRYLTMFIGAIGLMPQMAIVWLAYFIFGFIESKDVYNASIVVFSACGAEVIKFLLLIIILKTRRQDYKPFKILSFSVGLSMGFAASEILIWMATMQHYADIRALLGIPMHITAAVIMGSMLAKNAAQQNILTGIKPLLALGLALIYHASYDFLFLGMLYDRFLLPWLIVMASGIILSVVFTIKIYNLNMSEN